MAISGIKVSIKTRKWVFWLFVAPQYLIIRRVLWVPKFMIRVEPA